MVKSRCEASTSQRGVFLLPNLAPGRHRPFQHNQILPFQTAINPSRNPPATPPKRPSHKPLPTRKRREGVGAREEILARPRTPWTEGRIAEKSFDSRHNLPERRQGRSHRVWEIRWADARFLMLVAATAVDFDDDDVFRRPRQYPC